MPESTFRVDLHSMGASFCSNVNPGGQCPSPLGNAVFSPFIGGAKQGDHFVTCFPLYNWLHTPSEVRSSVCVTERR